MKGSYVAIDLETTGLDPKTDKIIEIGAVKVRDGKIVSEYSALVQPRRTLSEAVTGLTGITDELLQDAPGVEDIIGFVVEYCEDLPLLGHHTIFDFSFLKRAAVNHGLEFSCTGIDTLKLCRQFMPPEVKKNLTSACRFFQIENPHAHRALADAYAAHTLYQALFVQYGQEHMEAFTPKTLLYKVKMEQPATKRQKEHLRDLVKYHKISLSVEIDYLTRNEVSRITDKIISKLGRI